MVATAENLTCPGCGEPWTLNMTECPSCHRPVVITTFNSVYSMPGPEANKYASTYRKMESAAGEDLPEIDTALAFCYLKLGLRDKALEKFEQAIEADLNNSETYFYAAVCLLGGKKAFLASRETIDKVLEYLNAAIMIEPRGIYLYFMAYVKYDFFERKYLNTTPDYRQCFDMAMQAGTSPTDVQILFETLCVPNPFS